MVHFLANYFKKSMQVLFASAQHSPRRHLCARTRRTAPELPAAVPGLLTAPRFRQHPHSCAPHPRTPRTPLAEFLGPARQTSVFAHDPTHPRLRVPSTAVRARRTQSRLPHPLRPRLRTDRTRAIPHEPTRPRSHTSCGAQ